MAAAAELRACSQDAAREAVRLGYSFVALDHAVDAESLSRKSEYGEQLELVESLRSSSSDHNSKILSRVTILLEGPRADLPKAALNFDIVAVEPLTEASFAWACDCEKVDVISVRCLERSFVLSRRNVLKALERGACFELCYAPAIEHPNTVRHLAATAARLGDACRGKGLLFSSRAKESHRVRPSDQVENLARVFFDNNRFVSHARCLLDRILTRKKKRHNSYRGGVYISRDQLRESLVVKTTRKKLQDRDAADIVFPQKKTRRLSN